MTSKAKELGENDNNVELGGGDEEGGQVEIEQPSSGLSQNRSHHIRCKVLSLLVFIALALAIILPAIFVYQEKEIKETYNPPCPYTYECQHGEQMAALWKWRSWTNGTPQDYDYIYEDRYTHESHNIIKLCISQALINQLKYLDSYSYKAKCL